jgi:proline racemase
MWRCVESISAKRCGKSFIAVDEVGGFGGRGAGTVEVLAVAVPVGVVKLHEAGAALDETAGEVAVLRTQEGQFLPPISPAHLIAKPFLSGG